MSFPPEGEKERWTYEEVLAYLERQPWGPSSVLYRRMKRGDFNPATGEFWREDDPRFVAATLRLPWDESLA